VDDDDAVLSLLRSQASRSSVLEVKAVYEHASRLDQRRRTTVRLYALIAVAAIGAGAAWALASRHAPNTERVSPPATAVADSGAVATDRDQTPVSTQTPMSPSTLTTVGEPAIAACPAGGASFMLQLSEMRLRSGLPPACVAAGVFTKAASQPPCWATCSSGSVVRSVEVGPTSETSDPSGGIRRYTTLVRVDYGTADDNRWVIEAITHTSEGDREPMVIDWQRVDDPNTTRAGAATVTEYLTALESGDYNAAAVLLGEGGQDSSERADLEGLTPPNDLAEALRRRCASSICVAATVGLARPTFGAGAEVTVRFGDGASVAIVGYSYEGAPAVTGVPPESGG
jgi:hypothetical protein